jgi:drug/metabolite transporter (DMT)-like permease
MPPSTSPNTGYTWLLFALLTVASWGVYGVFLHIGQTGMNVPGMPPDPNARYKAFLFVGIAYFLVAVLAPLVILKMEGATWGFPAAGSWWSLIAGVVGAVGAFGVLLAFGAKGKPPEVMAIVFAGAPVVNALVSLWITRSSIDWGKVSPLFYAGIVLALAGGAMVTLYKPAGAPHGPAKPTASSSTAEVSKK